MTVMVETETAVAVNEQKMRTISVFLKEKGVYASYNCRQLFYWEIGYAKWTFCYSEGWLNRKMNPQELKEKMKKHRDTFIQAFDGAEKYNLQILIDFHTVPDSQNGYDDGGLTGVCKWCKNPDEVEFALGVLERLAQRYGKRNGLYGIEVLNEPISWLVYITAPSTQKAEDKKEAKGSGHVPSAFLEKFHQSRRGKKNIFGMKLPQRYRLLL